MDQTQPLHHQFTRGHVSLIFGALLVLATFLFIKDPQYFRLSAFSNNEPADNRVALQYQPYVVPAQPAVLGASTNDNVGPEIINEDGTVESAVDAGSVLGANTDRLETDLTTIMVRTTASNSAAASEYLQSMSYWETTAIDQNEFEAALTSNNQAQINTQSAKMETMLYYLEGMVVPFDAAQLHKLKIAQYRSAITLLRNFSQADDNPELVADELGVFLESQEQQDAEVAGLQQKYNL